MKTDHKAEIVMRTLNSFIVGLVILGAASILFAQNKGPATISEPNYGIRLKLGVMVPMRDGVELSTDIYLPDASGAYPVILARTPYDNSTGRYDRLGKFYAARGYAFAIQDCRGRYDSDGRWVPHTGEDVDGYDSIEWLAQQPWCDGNVGMTGVSYVGFVQWMAASQQPPHLKCIFTYGSPSSIYGDTWFQYGTLYLMDTITWAFGMDGRTWQNLGVDDWSDVSHLPLTDLDNWLGREIWYWDEWLSHPDFDAYWKKQGMIGRYDRVNIPAVTVTGWYDDGQLGALENYYGVAREGMDFAKTNQKVIIGYWRHGGPYPQSNNYYTKLGAFDFGEHALLDLQEYELRWFDHWLKGFDNGIMSEPKALLFIMGDNVWRGVTDWPIPGTRYTNFYFHSNGRANSMYGDGTLSIAKPKEEPADRYVYDPADPVRSVRGGEGARGGISSDPIDQRVNERRNDVLCFTSEPLQDDVEITGPVKVILYAASSAKDTDFGAKLVNVFPNGAAYNVCYAATGLITARFRQSQENPSLLQPGEVYEYEIPLRPTAMVFRKGHRIRVEVTSSDFPIYNRNLNTGEDPYTSTEMVAATQTVYHDAGYPSHIVLPLIP